eukprot:g9221.t1
MNPDPVRNLGPWSFTIQQETPVHWLRSGPLESYLLKCEVEVNHVDGALVSTGVLLHSGDDILGGGSVWMEIKDGRKVYCLGGNDLASKPIVTQGYPVHTVVRNGRNVIIEEWEFLMQGYTGCAFFDGRRIRIKFSLKRGKGSIAFFNSSKSPVWENGEAFDQLFSGMDVLFRNIRLTVVAKKVELDSFLKDPQVKVTEPAKKVKELWNESEMDTKRKRAERRAQLNEAAAEKKGPPEVGDVGPEHLGENLGNIQEIEEKIAAEPVVFSHGTRIAEERRRKATQKMNLLQRQKELVENMGESVLFSSSRDTGGGNNLNFVSGGSSSSTRGRGGGGSTTTISGLGGRRAHALSEAELTADRQRYDDEWFRKSSDFGLYAQKYEFGLPPELEKKPPGQHIRNRDKQFVAPAAPSGKDLDAWNRTAQELRTKFRNCEKKEIPESELLGMKGAARLGSASLSPVMLGVVARFSGAPDGAPPLLELRTKPTLSEIPESELLGMKRRLVTYLESTSERISKTREELTALAAKRGLAEEKHPRTVQQQLIARQLELEQKLSKDQREEINLMEKVREVDLELQDLRTEKPSVRELLPPILQQMLDEDEARLSHRVVPPKAVGFVSSFSDSTNRSKMGCGASKGAAAVAVTDAPAPVLLKTADASADKVAEPSVVVTNKEVKELPEVEVKPAEEKVEEKVAEKAEDKVTEQEGGEAAVAEEKEQSDDKTEEAPAAEVETEEKVVAGEGGEEEEDVAPAAPVAEEAAEEQEVVAAPAEEAAEEEPAGAEEAAPAETAVEEATPEAAVEEAAAEEAAVEEAAAEEAAVEEAAPAAEEEAAPAAEEEAAPAAEEE